MRRLERLRELREMAGLSQERLSEISGVGRATVADLEAGKRPPRPSTARKLADALGVDIPELVGVVNADLKAEAPSMSGQAYKRALGEFILELLEEKGPKGPPLEELSDEEQAAVLRSYQRGKASGRPEHSGSYFVEEDPPERAQLVEEALRVLAEEYQRTSAGTRGSK